MTTTEAEPTVEFLLEQVDAAEARCDYWRRAAYRLADKILRMEAKKDA